MGIRPYVCYPRRVVHALVSCDLWPFFGCRQRRVYLDLGGRSFDSSVEWFLHWYPLDFSEVHVFEAEPGLFVLPELSGWNFPVSEHHTYKAWTHT